MSFNKKNGERYGGTRCVNILADKPDIQKTTCAGLVLEVCNKMNYIHVENDIDRAGEGTP